MRIDRSASPLIPGPRMPLPISQSAAKTSVPSANCRVITPKTSAKLSLSAPDCPW